MKEITVYMVGNKIFTNREEALSFETSLKVTADNVLPFFRGSDSCATVPPSLVPAPVIEEEEKEEEPIHNYTGYGKEGALYRQTKDLSIKEITALIRKEARELAKKEGCKVSVSFDTFSGGCSVSLAIKELSFNPYTEEYTKAVREGKIREWIDNWSDNGRPDTYNERYENFRSKLEAALEKYNYRDCDSMTDYFNVNYYTHCGIDWQTKAALEDKIVSGEIK